LNVAGVYRYIRRYVSTTVQDSEIGRRDGREKPSGRSEDGDFSGLRFGVPFEAEDQHSVIDAGAD
jgi:hypothetical protein